MFCFVGCQDMLKPRMCKLMRSYPKKRSVFASTSYKCEHGVFHSSISSLNDRVLLVRICSYLFVKETHEFCSIRLEFFPVFNNFWLVLIEKMKRYIIWPWVGIVDIFWISGPCEIVDLRCYKMPSNVSFCGFWFFSI